jgi:hypothetical protein
VLSTDPSKPGIQYLNACVAYDLVETLLQKSVAGVAIKEVKVKKKSQKK